MKNLFNRGLVALAAVLALSACDLDLTNPNALSEEDVLRTANGIISLSVGVQKQYATSVAEWVRAPALVTDEWGTNTGSLTSYRSLLTGDDFEATFAVVESPWASTYRVVRSANAVLANVDEVGLDAGTATGIRATAKLYKAMALGRAILQYEEVPVDVTVEFAVPQPREVVLDSVLALLESARAALATRP
ncbi:MAG TPA: hypothetical protein VHG91_09655, partial [Longimicrobium sp.]|nr:hypothetical protein [Longimicrobium sp.]